MGNADPTKPEAPAAKREQTSRRRWTFGLSACAMVLLVLAVLALMYRTNQWMFAPGAVH